MRDKLGSDSFRHRVDYRKDNLYIVIVPSKKEVFISSVDRDPDELTQAALDGFGRLIALAWEGSSTEEVVKQLRKASRTKRDIPGILAKLLTEDCDDLCEDKTD